jgi:hypothetical protein
MTMSDDFEFRPLDHSPAEIERISALLREVFPHAPYLTPDYLRWLYMENPEGRALGWNAFFDGEMIGHCAGQPLTASLDGAPHRGILLLNTAARRQHMRQNVTRRTSDPMFEEAARQGYSFAIAVGNAFSTKPLLTRFAMVGPLEARIGVGCPARGPRNFTPSFERIWTPETLRWRLSNPERTYAVRARGTDLTVVSPSGRPGTSAILYDGHNAWDMPSSRNRTPDPLHVWLGLDSSIAWRRSAYVRIPDRLRPSPLNLVFKDLTGGALQPDAGRILFRAMDFDPF